MQPNIFTSENHLTGNDSNDKHGKYKNCTIMKFLLQRAMFSRRLGHFLLWALRNEQERLCYSGNNAIPGYQFRITIMIDVYIRCSGHYGNQMYSHAYK